MQNEKLKTTTQNSKLKNFTLRALRFALQQSKTTGFTLLELVILLGILSVVTIATIGFQRDFFRLNRLVEGSLDQETAARKIFKQFVAEVRSASQSSIGGYPIEQANTTSFIFFADADNDGAKERIRYFLVGTVLKKGVVKPSGSPLTYNSANEMVRDLIKEVSSANPVFYYYDSAYDGSGSAMSQPVNIPSVRMIKMNLVIDTNGPNPPLPVTFTTQAMIRNLKYQ